MRPLARSITALSISTLLLACAEPEEARHRASPAEPDARIVDAPRVMVPDEALVDQDGREVRLVDLFAVRAVAVNFVFTTCTTICSPMTAIFAKLARDLGPSLDRDVRLVSISLDPATDTPDKLRAYADRFDRRAGWTFLTGPPERVARVQKALGGAVSAKERHAPITMIGNLEQGRWRRVDGLAPAARLAAWMTGAP